MVRDFKDDAVIGIFDFQVNGALWIASMRMNNQVGTDLFHRQGDLVSLDFGQAGIFHRVMEKCPQVSESGSLTGKV